MEYITKLHQDEIKDREKHMIVYIYLSPDRVVVVKLLVCPLAS